MSVELYKIKNILNSQGIIFCFSGPTTHDILMTIGDTLKQKMKNESAAKSTVNKVFSVFIEQAENIARYSAEKEKQENGINEASLGIVALGRKDKKYFVVCGNLIENDKAEKLLKKLTTIQKMDKKQLKDYYKQQRKKGSDEDSKGAGIGFIEIARNSTEKIDFHIEKIDNQFSFFSMKAVI